MAFLESQCWQSAPGADGNRVLLIERDPAVGRSLELMLTNAGFYVALTTLGKDGLSFANTGDFDLVLLGPNPPELTGGDLRSSLRLGRIDASFRLLSVSATAGGGNAMQITPCA